MELKPYLLLVGVPSSGLLCFPPKNGERMSRMLVRHGIPKGDVNISLVRFN